MPDLYAHSARPERGIPAQTYQDHINAVVNGARRRGKLATCYRQEMGERFRRALTASGELHDLGKVEDIKQAVLASASKERLPGVPHEEAGVAYLVNKGDLWSASLVAAHHNGLFDGNEQRERATSIEKPPLLRNLDSAVFDHIDKNLDLWLRLHESTMNKVTDVCASSPPDPVTLRLSLSCLVDADHTDTANHFWGESSGPFVRRKWGQRRAMLQAFADEKPQLTPRDKRRRQFFEACRDRQIKEHMLSCSAPVGSGKTLAVMAHLLRVAEERRLRHIFVVLPFTNIITQTVNEYRQALKLPGENPAEVVAELHHQVDFSSHELRNYAALWKAPVIVTTAVGFFETLCGSSPLRLRKMHELPGSAVFIDEAHAALPAHLLPLAWKWLVNLCDKWGIHVVLGSGTLFPFWDLSSFPLDKPDRRDVPELTPAALLDTLQKAEQKRITPTRIEHTLTIDKLVTIVTKEPGSKVVVLNTVQTAATVALAFQRQQFKGTDVPTQSSPANANPSPVDVNQKLRSMCVLHLSTALAPVDRAPIIEEIKRRLRDEPKRRWVLVATSCIEAGLNFSFRAGYRESSTVSSLLQLGGRVRRNEEKWVGKLYSFKLTGDGVTNHPDMVESSAIVDQLLAEGSFQCHDPSTLLKMHFGRSLNRRLVGKADALLKLEKGCQFPQVEKTFRVIDSDTRIVVVKPDLVARIEANEKLSFAELMKGSAQIYATKLDSLPCQRILGRDELWAWTGTYDSEFLGYMKGVFETQEFFRRGGSVT